ncbi:MAG: hypothetical protein GQ564_20840 [Bacteroidales bacterium]|nr:hypothetical protein [Bacteroidales bacterium]
MKKLIAMMLMLASVFFISCNDDDDKDDEGTNPLTVAEAQQEFTQLGAEMSGMITDMEEVQGVDVLMMISELPDPFSALNKSTANTNVINNIKKYVLPNTIFSKEKGNLEEVGFDFEYYKGIYTYYHTPIPRWEWVDDADKIEINFPSDETNMTNNDAKMTISSYSEVMITEYDDYGEYYDYVPNDIEASLELNSIEILSLDMSATWITSGDAASEPTALDVDVFLLPFDFHVDFTHASTTVDVNAWIKYDAATIFSVGLDAVFASTDMDNPPLTIGGYIQLFDVRFDADVNLAAFMLIIEGMDSENPVYTSPELLETAINGTFDASVSVNGAEAADIIIDIITFTPAEGEFPIDVLFVYNDGTSESAIPYFEGFVAQVIEFFGGMEDFYL